VLSECYLEQQSGKVVNILRLVINIYIKRAETDRDGDLLATHQVTKIQLKAASLSSTLCHSGINWSAAD
jgi:hypothetical protein